MPWIFPFRLHTVCFMFVATLCSLYRRLQTLFGNKVSTVTFSAIYWVKKNEYTIQSYFSEKMLELSREPLGLELEAHSYGYM